MKIYKEFTEGTLYDKLMQCFGEGYRPMTADEFLEYQNENDVSSYVANASVNGKNIIIKTKEDVEALKISDGWLLWFGSLGNDNSFTIGYDNLDNSNGRLFGVKEE